MIKNQANICQFVLRNMIGQGVTGLSPTVQIRKDSGTFAATTNAPTEVGYGAYEVILTATECNCDVMMFMVTLPDGQFPAILENERLITTGGATPAEIWQYNGGRTVDNTIPTVNEIWGRQAGDTTSRTLTSSPTDISSLATASALSSVANNVNAVKAKTDNLPTSPAATGDIPSVASIQSGLAKASDLSGLSTFDPTTDTVLIDATQAAGMATATGFATPSDIPTDYAKATDIPTSDISAIKAKTDNLPASPAATGDIPTSKINSVYAGIYNWQLQKAGSVESIIAKDANGDTLTESIVTRNTAGEIVQMEEDNE